MPFVRYSRDKRGYEYTYLMHGAMRRGKPGKARLLYWYRTPPGIKAGRVAFDATLQRSLEQQYPDIAFDWQAIVNTPMPPPDMTEFWRERRRMERAAKAERRAAEAEEAAEAASPAVGQEPSATSDREDEAADPGADSATEGAGDTAGNRKRRRRGGRRRRGRGAVDAVSVESGSEAPDPSNASPSTSED